MSKNVFDISQELMSNAYPGRGIILGRTPDNKKNVIAYFIMGRSENSRNRIFEIDLPAMTVCDMTLVEHLQKNVEYIRMGLLDLVKQNHRIWISPHLLRELTALLISDVSRR